MLNIDPLTLYNPSGESRKIPSVDAPAWINSGWFLSLSKANKSLSTEETIDDSKKQGDELEQTQKEAKPKDVTATSDDSKKQGDELEQTQKEAKPKDVTATSSNRLSKS